MCSALKGTRAVKLAHQFYERWISVCCNFLEINSMKYYICNIHIHENLSKDLFQNDLSFILIYCEITYNLHYDFTFRTLFYGFE